METLTRIKTHWRKFSRSEWENATGYVPSTLKRFISQGTLTASQEARIQTHLLNRIDDLNESVINLCKKPK